MKIHRPLFQAIVQALDEIISKENYANFVIQKLLKENKKWGAKDRRFVVESVMEILKNLLFLQQGSSENANYQKIVATHFYLQTNENLEFFNLSSEELESIDKLKKAKFPDNVLYSMPEWIYEILEKDRGKIKSKQLAKTLLEKSDTFIRINTSKTTIEKCIESLKNQEVELIPTTLPHAFRLVNRKDLSQTEAFQQGWIEIQDIGSQMIGDFCKDQNPKSIIDACAGAGGKSLHLADLFPKAKITAMDVVEKKLIELEKRALRNGFKTITTKLHSEENHQSLSADLVLIDAPCSGLGVLKRNPDDKWKLSPQKLEGITELQQSILNNYSQFVNENGTLIYATCSILKKENEEQVSKFISNNANFELVEQKTILPSSETDGFFMARLKRKK